MRKSLSESEFRFNEIKSKYNIMLPDYEQIKKNYENYIKENELQ